MFSDLKVVHRESLISYSLNKQLVLHDNLKDHLHIYMIVLNVGVLFDKPSKVPCLVRLYLCALLLVYDLSHVCVHITVQYSIYMYLCREVSLTQGSHACESTVST